MSTDATDIVALSAVALSAAIRSRTVSCVAVMDAYLDRIAAINPAVNAIVSLQDRVGLLRAARERDAEVARGTILGPLHGFPLAVKDGDAVAGLPFTQGSPIFRNRIAESDSLMVARLRASGALFIGKTNTPEFGLGSQTFNPVFGATRNAYDRTKTAGGSSGGAAVAVSLRLQPVADGSDHAGSLRNPAAFNNVFGLRPSFGRIPTEARDAFTPGLAVSGAIGRSPADIGLMLSVQAGYDAASPYSNRQDPAVFAGDLTRDFSGTRIAWLGDFDGHVPFEPGLLDLDRSALSAFETIGCRVEAACPAFDMEALWHHWLTLRAWMTASNLRPLYDDPAHRALMKPEAIWEVERGLALSADQVTTAQEGRTVWYATLRRFMTRYDFLVLPSTQVFPFDVTQRWPKFVGGRAMSTYHRWMEVVVPITMSGLPALNVPAGFDADGRPAGIQIVGPNHGEFACLQLGAAYDAATGWVTRRPPPLNR
ncbi:amidase [Methylobacterium sp. BTF04]|uniref:amidase n=1 Tax=Methylobacterium sp. BTF04 TaxID=2708300 RepID=UPI0013D256A7|nr:amidase [Methylobacterium sp. BTF04]NEU12914.1 amidase [Methylobacterium sp. BTF04]